MHKLKSFFFKVFKGWRKFPLWIKIIITFFIIFFIGFFLYLHFAFAAANVWGGGTNGCNGLNNGNWNVAENWSLHHVPTTTDTATFNSTCTQNVNIDAAVSLTTGGFDIQSTYTDPGDHSTGTITQNANTISMASFGQAAGTFTQGATITLTSTNTSALTAATNAFYQTGGTFTGGSSDITLSGGFFLNSGSFTSTSGILNIARGFTISGSPTFTHHSGTVNFTGSLSADDSTVACGSSTFNLVTITKTSTGGDVNVNSGCTIPLGASPTITGGILTNLGSITASGTTVTFNMTFQQTSSSTGSLTLTGTTTLTFEDKISTNGGSAANLTLTGTGGSVTATSLTTLNLHGSFDNSANQLSNTSGLAVTLNGSGSGDDGTITCGTGNADRFSSVAISKGNSGADVTIASSCNNTNGSIPLGSSPTITGGLLTNAGTITASGTTVTFNMAYTQTGGSLTLTSTTTWDFNERNSQAGLPADLNLTGGTLTASSLTALNEQGDLNNSASLLSSPNVPNGLAITLDGISSASDCTFTPGSTNFGSLTINKTNVGGLTVFAGSFTITGGFTRTDGIISNPGSAYTMTVQGDISILTSDAVGGANLTIQLTGTASQNISASSVAIDSILNINKASGTASLTANLTILTQTCTLTSGTFDLNGFVFVCGSTFEIKSGSTLQLVGNESNSIMPTIDSGSTVTYKGASGTNSYYLAQWPYQNLIINAASGTNTFYITAPTTTIAGALTVTAGTLSSISTSYTPSLDNYTSGYANAKTLTINHTVNNATGRMLIVGFSAVASTACTAASATWGGISMTLLNTTTQSTLFGGVLYLANPALGTANVVLTLTCGNTPDLAGAALEVKGTFPSLVPPSFTAIPGNSTSASLTLINATNDLLLDNFGWDNGAPAVTATAGTNQTITYNQTGGNIADDSSTKTGTANTSMSWTLSSARNYIFQALVFPVVGASSLTVTGLTTVNGGTLSPGGLNITANGNFTMSSGTFNGGTGTLTTPVFTLSNGTFNAPSGNMNISSTFTHSGGTFTSNYLPNSTLVATDNVTFTGSTTFNNLSAVTAGKTLTFTAGDTFTILGNFLVTGASGNLISIKSGTASSQWYINLNGSSAVTYASVTDSGCATGTADVGMDATDTNVSGNGTCWVFYTVGKRINGNTKINGNVRFK